MKIPSLVMEPKEASNTLTRLAKTYVLDNILARTTKSGAYEKGVPFRDCYIYTFLRKKLFPNG